MDDVRGPLGGGKRVDPSARAPKHASRAPNTSGPADNDDGEGTVLAEVMDVVLEAWARESVSMLRARLRQEFAARLPHLVTRPRRGRRVALSPEDAAPVDDVTRARARAVLDAHGVPRGGR